MSQREHNSRSSGSVITNDLKCFKHAQFKPSQHRFESILTVPPEIQDRVFRWVGEFNLCERAATLGKALDAVTGMYTELMSQFSQTADVRDRFLQAPTSYMVAPMYFCERTLDGIADTLLCIRKNIVQLFAEVKSLRILCFENYTSEHKVCCEMETEIFGENRPSGPFNVPNFIKAKREKATTFLHLSKRLESVANGGSTMFKFLDRPWDLDVSLDNDSDDDARENQSPDKEEQPKTNKENTTNGQKHKQKENSNENECTPVEHSKGPSEHLREHEKGQSATVPETPEQQRIAAPDLEITQTSLQGKQQTTEEKKSRLLKRKVQSQPLYPINLKGGANGSQQKTTRSHQSTARIVTPSNSKQDKQISSIEKREMGSTKRRAPESEKNSVLKRQKTNKQDAGLVRGPE